MRNKDDTCLGLWNTLTEKGNHLQAYILLSYVNATLLFQETLTEEDEAINNFIVLGTFQKPTYLNNRWLN